MKEDPEFLLASEMELFVIIVNSWTPLTTVAENIILDIRMVLGSTLINIEIHSILSE